MKKLFAVFAVLLTAAFAFAEDSKIFKVEGPERSYNQIRLVNETSLSNFKCRLIELKLKKDGTYQDKGTFGTFELKENGDTDSVTNSVKRNSYFGLEMPKDYTGTVSITLSYEDHPFFDVVVVHISDDSTEFEKLKI